MMSPLQKFMGIVCMQESPRNTDQIFCTTVPDQAFLDLVRFRLPRVEVSALPAASVEALADFFSSFLALPFGPGLVELPFASLGFRPLPLPLLPLVLFAFAASFLICLKSQVHPQMNEPHNSHLFVGHACLYTCNVYAHANISYVDEMLVVSIKREKIHTPLVWHYRNSKRQAFTRLCAKDQWSHGYICFNIDLHQTSPKKLFQETVPSRCLSPRRSHQPA